MAYEGGQLTVIPFGNRGLTTDVPQTQMEPEMLQRAVSVSPRLGLIEKEPGSKRYNDVAIDSGSGIVSMFDWWPTPEIQRLIVATKSNKIFRITNKSSNSEITSNESTPTDITTGPEMTMTAGGGEATGNNRKLFILTGSDAVQVISGDATIRLDIETPAADWTGSNQPFFSIIHRGRHWAFGNKNAPHRVYASDTSNHEAFAGGDSTSFNIYPGDGERLLSSFTYKGKLFFVKFPQGLFLLDDSDIDIVNWTVNKISDTFGGASSHCTVQALEDVLIANSYGSVTSLAATDRFGDVQSADVLAQLGVQEHVRKNYVPVESPSDKYIIYYPDKKQVMTSYRAKSSSETNRILIGDMSLQNPRVTVNEKDQPNCLALMKDTFGVLRPIYGANDGYVYFMDQEDREVQGLKPPEGDMTVEPSVASGNLGNGKYKYGVTFSDGSSETTMSPVTRDHAISFTFSDSDVSTGSDTITEADHGLVNGTQVNLSTTGTLPTGLDNDTDYYIVERTQNTVKLSLTSGGAAVNVTAAAGGGTHTLKTIKNQEFEIVDNTTAGQASLASIPIDLNSVATERKLYRTKVDGSQFFLLATIGDNTTTTYTDNIADGSLGATRPNKNTFSSAYTSEFRIADADYGQAGAIVGESEKNYDFLEITYEASGDFEVDAQIFVDGVLRSTIPFRVDGRSDLDEMQIEHDILDSEVPRSIKKPISSSGRRLSILFKNSNLMEDFRLLSARVYYRLSGQNQRK